MPGSMGEVSADGSIPETLSWGPEGGKLFMADGSHLTPEANEALRSALLDLGLTSEE